MGLGGAAALLLALTEPLPAPRQHPSPDGRYAAVLASDTSFGQVEHLRVLINPGTSGARMIFEAAGDVPLRFRGWRDAATAELEEPPHDGDGPGRLLLRCTAEACRLDRSTQP